MTVNILDLVFRKKSSEISLLNFNCQLLIVSFSEGLEHRGGLCSSPTSFSLSASRWDWSTEGYCAPVLPASHCQLLGGTDSTGGIVLQSCQLLIVSFSLSASHSQLLL